MRVTWIPCGFWLCEARCSAGNPAGRGSPMRVEDSVAQSRNVPQTIGGHRWRERKTDCPATDGRQTILSGYCLVEACRLSKVTVSGLGVPVLLR